MARRYPNNLPSSYGREKLSRTRSDWNGPAGEILRRMVPIVFPRLPVEAHLGFVQNAMWTEDTALSPDHASFHEMGGYGITGGPWDRLPIPNCEPGNNDWCRLANDPRVVSLLGGRSATMSPFQRSGGGYAIPLEDQIAVGVVSLRTKIDGVNAVLRGDIRALDVSSLWATAMSFAGWSAGTASFARRVNGYADQIAGYSEAQRWPALVRAVAQAVSEGRERAGMSHGCCLVYTMVRTLQKIRSGRELAAVTGGDVGWFGTFDDSAEDVIARAAGGASGGVLSQVRQEAEEILEDFGDSKGGGESSEDFLDDVGSYGGKITQTAPAAGLLLAGGFGALLLWLWYRTGRGR